MLRQRIMVAEQQFFQYRARRERLLDWQTESFPIDLDQCEDNGRCYRRNYQYGRRQTIVAPGIPGLDDFSRHPRPCNPGYDRTQE